ncbi:MAG: nucleotidyl transferase AbiEii/AbiGii toxin family protein [Calditrichaeota bacterium]|nr:nucleotidyl transferase AbiEii/AbiGii toxin family protein [Calditrichota bacterium]MCB0293952.1 nucleotidyl transferase AbiEii/AbiGii toxin family protein [Calditrichota bacterium]MCB0303066.1 nucleotidyl transferase AbiEii/AbiGii toxin family protein [Calditrichota bacterium]MCB0314713.1 nucleotidyl transferase AbiEii/AbiGii toxin family protein [Calditrichota bacterium]MCB9089135.1 nucleotidyl transferase AbiEii/AbiGii toxin family protein [Calditrichia bacterium]
MKNFQAILSALSAGNVDYILIGGLAVAYHGIPRFTEDIDLFVRRDPENISRLKNALRMVFDDESINEITYDDLVEYAVVRYGTPDDFYIDVMDRIGEAFTYEDLEYEVIEMDGIPVRIATIETLIKLKKGTIREVDRLDVAMLQEKLQGGE